MNRRHFLSLPLAATTARGAADSLSCAAASPEWLKDHDREIRARLRRGEEDSLVNFILFGVSFTPQPQVLLAAQDPALINARVRDFLLALRPSNSNERLELLRSLLPVTDTEEWIRRNITRYLDEQKSYRTVLDRATPESPAAAHLYKDRGLSIDTSFRPNLAIEKTLAGLRQRGTLTRVTRAAIIGPGLDFTDKDSGFDYYPLQTLQPFAVIDSLLRLGLAKMPELTLMVADISPHTLRHLEAARGKRYTIQLVLDETRPWNAATVAYWRRVGDRVGRPATPLAPPPQVRNVETRAISIPPEVMTRIATKDLDIVAQRPRSGGFDLVIGTNVFVYYDAREQALALSNIESMLASGGVLLSNTRMTECPGLSLHRIGEDKVEYSTEPGDADVVYIYLKSALRRSLAPE